MTKRSNIISRPSCSELWKDFSFILYKWISLKIGSSGCEVLYHICVNYIFTEGFWYCEFMECMVWEGGEGAKTVISDSKVVGLMKGLGGRGVIRRVGFIVLA